MHTQLAYHANVAQMDALRRQAAAYRHTQESTRTKRRFRLPASLRRAANRTAAPASMSTTVA